MQVVASSTHPNGPIGEAHRDIGTEAAGNAHPVQVGGCLRVSRADSAEYGCGICRTASDARGDGQLLIKRDVADFKIRKVVGNDPKSRFNEIWL